MKERNIELSGKTILVTGVAGFIGANLAKRLLSDLPDAAVVGIDNMNDYYDVRLKEERLLGLSHFGGYDFGAHMELVPMQPGDVPVTYKHGMS